MRYATLFGFLFELSGDNVSFGNVPGLIPRKWKVVVDANAKISIDVQIENVSSKLRAAIVVELPGDWASDGDNEFWLPRDGEIAPNKNARFQIAASIPKEAGFLLQLGAFDFRSKSTEFRVRDGTLCSCPSPLADALVPYHGLPFSFGTIDSTGGFTLHLATPGGELSLADSTLSLIPLWTGAPEPIACGPRFDAQATSLRLSDRGTASSLTLLPSTEGQALSLAASGTAVPRVQAIVDTAGLVIELERVPGKGSKFLDAMLFGIDSDIRLQCFGPRDAAGLPMTIMTQRCGIQWRPNAKSVPGTWFLSPMQEPSQVSLDGGRNGFSGQMASIGLEFSDYSEGDPTLGQLNACRLAWSGSTAFADKRLLCTHSILTFTSDGAISVQIGKPDRTFERQMFDDTFAPPAAIPLLGRPKEAPWPLSAPHDQFSKEELKLWRRALQELAGTASQPNFDVDPARLHAIESTERIWSAKDASTALQQLQASDTLTALLKRHDELLSVLGELEAHRPVAPDLAAPPSRAATLEDYVAIWQAQDFKTPLVHDLALEGGARFLLPRLPKEWRSSNDPYVKFPLAIYKISGSKTILEILKDLKIDPKLLAQEGLDPLGDEKLLSRDWTGVVLLFPNADVNANVSDNPFSFLIPEKVIRFKFVALSARDQRLTVALAAAALGTTSTSPPGWNGSEDEAFIRITNLDLLIRNDTMIRANVEAAVGLRSLFGIQLGSPPDPNTPQITLEGALDSTSGKYVLRAKLNAAYTPPMPSSLATNDGWPIGSIQISGVDVEVAQQAGVRQFSLKMSGTLKLKTKFWSFNFGKSNEIRFSNLALISIEVTPSRSAVAANRILKFVYRGINLACRDLQASLLKSSLFSLKLSEIYVRFEDNTSPDPYSESIVAIGSTPWPSQGYIALTFRTSWLDASSLAVEGGQPLHLDFVCGIPTGSNGIPTSDAVCVGLRSLSVKQLKLSLFRFLDVSAESLSFATNVDYPSIVLEQAVITSPWGNLFGSGEASIALFFDDKGAGGYFGLWDAKSTTGLQWLFAGKNVVLPHDVVTALLTPSPTNGDNKALSGLKDAFGNRSFIVGKGMADDRKVAGWSLGMSLNNEPAFEAKAVYQDGAAFGASVRGALFETLFPQGLSLAYLPGATAKDDQFLLQVALPSFSIGSISLLGPLVGIAIEPDGDFMVDVGFPWPHPRGGRYWERTVGMIVSPGQASGGVYLRRRTRSSSTELTLGLAVQWGVGVQIDFKLIRGYARLGWYAILEGGFEIVGSQVRILELQGAGGVVAEVVVEVSIWIASARFAAIAAAEARIRAAPILPSAAQGLLLGSGINTSEGRALMTGDTTVALATLDIAMAFELSFRATLTVSVDLGLFSVSRSVAVSFELEVTGKVKI